MAVTKLMFAASEKMEGAARRLHEAREHPSSPTALQEWLTALTDYVLALGEVQEYSQQSVHEKLQRLGRELHRPDITSPKRRADRGGRT